jgi:SAM-dependent methyltransferase
MPPRLPDRQDAQARPLPAASPNYFSGAEVAARYARVRPFFHAEVAERLRAFAGVERFGRVLDVGCGSGQSSIALAAIAGQVIAIDASQSMLDHAEAGPNIGYRLGSAEQLNLAVGEEAGEFDLVSAASALHWFDQDRFYPQCRQVLAPGGLLAVYNDHFTAHMQGSDACKRWMRTRFAKRFPPPRRGMRDFDEKKAAEFGFTVVHHSSFSHLVPFTRQELIAYLLTRSNTLAPLARGEHSQPSVVEWLDRELLPIVPDGATGSFIFKCNLWLMRQAAAPPGAIESRPPAHKVRS